MVSQLFSEVDSSLFLKIVLSYFHLHTNPIGNIPSGCLTRSNDLYYRPPPHPIVSCHRIVRLYARELRFTQSVTLEEFLFFILGKDLVLRNLRKCR